MYFNDFGLRPEAVENLTFCNLNSKFFQISFDTKNGTEVFQGTNRQQVAEQAAARIKRVTHARTQNLLMFKKRIK